MLLITQNLYTCIIQQHRRGTGSLRTNRINYKKLVLYDMVNHINVFFYRTVHTHRKRDTHKFTKMQYFPCNRVMVIGDSGKRIKNCFFFLIGDQLQQLPTSNTKYEHSKHKNERLGGGGRFEAIFSTFSKANKIKF